MHGEERKARYTLSRFGGERPNAQATNSVSEDVAQIWPKQSVSRSRGICTEITGACV